MKKEAFAECPILMHVFAVRVATNEEVEAWPWEASIEVMLEYHAI